MTTIFDGKAYAEKKILELDKEVANLKNKGIHPKLASILVGEDPASKLYVSLKKKKAESMGVEMDTYFFKEGELVENILALISILNSDPLVHGIMVQLPLPDPISNFKFQILNSIKLEKDVDGLHKDSLFVHPTSKAVFQIIGEANRLLGRDFSTIAVVGESGMVGSSLARKIKNSSLQLIKETKFADIVVSATGSPGIIKSDMIKEGAVVIDVGSPRGDVDPSVALRASFITPVPGGVGPVTISCLLENLIVSASKV